MPSLVTWRLLVPQPPVAHSKVSMDTASHRDIVPLLKDLVLHHPFRLLVLAFLIWRLAGQFRKGKQAREAGQPVPLDAMTPQLFGIVLLVMLALAGWSAGIFWAGNRYLGDANFGWTLAMILAPWVLVLCLYLRYYLARKRALDVPPQPGV